MTLGTNATPMPQHPVKALRTPAYLALVSLVLIACKPACTAALTPGVSQAPVNMATLQSLKALYGSHNENGPIECDAGRCDGMTDVSPKVWGRSLGIQPEDWDVDSEQAYYYVGQGVRIHASPPFGDHTRFVDVVFDGSQGEE